MVLEESGFSDIGYRASGGYIGDRGCRLIRGGAIDDCFTEED